MFSPYGAMLEKGATERRGCHSVVTPKRAITLRGVGYWALPVNLARTALVSGWRVTRPNPVELAAVVVLPGRGTLVIMEACALSSRQRAASTACAVLPLPGIVG